jgi:hypothetical protein
MKYFLLKVHYAPHMVGIIGVYDNQVAAEADCQILEKERPSLSSYHTVADEEAFKRLIEGTKKITENIYATTK